MSYSAALQKLIYDALLADPLITYVVGERVYDRAEPNATFPFITFGPSSTLLVQDDCLTSRTETFQIDIWSTDQAGKIEAKQICDLVIASLNGLEALMEDGFATDLRVVLAQVMDDPDGKTIHGVVQIEALIDEEA